jgi:pyridinium-3,5-biscarboxylic acid mononucleotide sulfurtransferase
MTLAEKSQKLNQIVRDTGGLAVAFSGGVDSSFLAAVAARELGERALAVTALSPTYPEHEQREAAELAAELGIRHEVVESNELDIQGFAENPVDRCYYCKSELFEVVREVAGRYGIERIADGTNADDMSDYRPGRRAACEQGVLSPLLEAGLGKEDIRALSRELGLQTASKPAFACLASRFPYGSQITEEKLRSIDRMESVLRELGFTQIRVRHHGDMARIELDPAELPRAADEAVRARIVETGRVAGFRYVALDLQGYRTGSMNEGLGLMEGGDA